MNCVLRIDLLNLHLFDFTFHQGGKLRSSEDIISNQEGKRVCCNPNFTDGSLRRELVNQNLFGPMSEFLQADTIYGNGKFFRYHNSSGHLTGFAILAFYKVYILAAARVE